MSNAVETIKLVCDSPEHARGKVATIAVYERFAEGWFAHNMPTRPRKRRTHQAARLMRRKTDAPFVTRESALLAAINPGERPCKLCGDRLQPEATDDELNDVATRGESRVSIRQLRLLRLGGKEVDGSH